MILLKQLTKQQHQPPNKLLQAIYIDILLINFFSIMLFLTSKMQIEMYINMAFYVCKFLKYINKKPHCISNLFPNISCGLDFKCYMYSRRMKKTSQGQNEFCTNCHQTRWIVRSRTWGSPTWSRRLSTTHTFWKWYSFFFLGGGLIPYLKLDPIYPQSSYQIFFTG